MTMSPAFALTKAQLRSKTLTISNMPTGWTVDNSSSSSSGSAIGGGCLAGVKEAPKTETKVEVSFDDGQFPQLEEELATGNVGQASYNRLNHVLAKCKHFSVASNRQTVTVTVGQMSFPQVGSETKAYGLTFTADGINFGADFVLFRVGSVVGLVEYGDFGQPDPSQLQAFVTEAVNRVEGKPAAAPHGI